MGGVQQAALWQGYTITTTIRPLATSRNRKGDDQYKEELDGFAEEVDGLRNVHPMDSTRSIAAEICPFQTTTVMFQTNPI